MKDNYGFPIDENGNIIWKIKQRPSTEFILKNPEHKKYRKCNNSKRPKKRK